MLLAGAAHGLEQAPEPLARHDQQIRWLRPLLENEGSLVATRLEPRDEGAQARVVASQGPGEEHQVLVRLSPVFVQVNVHDGNGLIQSVRGAEPKRTDASVLPVPECATCG